MLVLAHRGANRRAPENTLAAFALARDLGADGVELDVHRTLDDRLVVHHDAVAERLGVLRERSAAEIRSVRPDICTLEEALDVCAGLLVNVELKNLPGDLDFDPEHRVADALVSLLASRGGPDTVLVSSFNLESIDRVRELDPRAATAFLTIAGFDLQVAIQLAVDRGHGAIHPRVDALRGRAGAAAVTAAHRARRKVHPWTVNEPADVEMLAALDVDAIITDVPEMVLTTLGRNPASPA